MVIVNDRNAYIRTPGHTYCTPLVTDSPRDGIVTATLEPPQPRHALLLSFLQPLLQCNVRPSPPQTHTPKVTNFTNANLLSSQNYGF
jgi:hypothetical protein